MAIEVRGETIETDEAGFITDPKVWNQDVAIVLANDEGVDMTETHWGMVDYVREYYKENQTHPTMHILVKNLGTHLGKTFREEKAYVKYLYQLFPRDPVSQLCRIAGLPKPLSAEYDG